MSTLITIPGYLIHGRDSFDVNAFMVANGGYTVVNRKRSKQEWIIEVNENLNSAQQTALSDALISELSEIKFTVS